MMNMLVHTLPCTDNEFMHETHWKWVLYLQSYA